MQQYLDLFEKIFSPGDVKIRILDPLCKNGDALMALKQIFPQALCYGVEQDRVLGAEAIKKVEYFYASSPFGMRKGRKCFDIVFLNVHSEMIKYRGGIDYLDKACLKEWADCVSLGGHLIVQLQNKVKDEKFFALLEPLGFEIACSFSHSFGDTFVFRRSNCLSTISIEPNNLMSFDELQQQNICVNPSVFRPNVIFFPEKGIEIWQLVAMAEKAGAGTKINDLIFSKRDVQSDLAIDTPNDGQSIMLMSFGLLNKKIAGRYVIKGGVKRQMVKKLRENGDGVASDIFSSRIYAFDCQLGKYSLLE